VQPPQPLMPIRVLGLWWLATAVSLAAPAQQLPLRHLSTVRATPDDTVLAGGFIRLGYVPALDRMVAAFTTMKLAQPQGGCTNAAHVYKVYTTDMQPEGSSVVLNCGYGDSADVFVDNDLYDVSCTQTGWHIVKYDAVTWATLAEVDYDFADPRMLGGDEMAEMVNGMLDVSGMYAPPGSDLGDTATHHNFFTPDLQLIGQRILADTRNTNGSSMLFLDNTYHFVTGSPGPDIILMRYDTDWNYLGAKLLREQGMWSEGIAFDGQRFYVAYMDTTLVTGPPTPICTNIRLAAFDLNWDFIGDLAVTNYSVADDVEAWRPWLTIHDDRLYVSYDVVPHDPVQHTEVPEMMQAYVDVFEIPTDWTTCSSFTISPMSASASASAGSQQVTVTGSPSGCTGGSWTASGNGSWLAVSPAGGTGSGSVTVSWEANAGTAQRTTTATIAGNAFTATQAGSGAGFHPVRRRLPRWETLPLRYLETVQVTPDEEFANGGLGYIHYVAATDRFIVMVQTTLSAGRTVNLTWGSETCSDRALAYKEYDTDMQPTGSFGYFSCAHEDDYDIADVTTRLIGNDLYVVGQVLTTAWKGWRLERFDVTTWQRLAVTEVHLDYPAENEGGPNISFINGQVDVAGGYAPTGPWVGSHHHQFTRDLRPLGEKILCPPEYPVNVPELSMLQPADDIYLFAGGGTEGLTVLRLDKDWDLIEEVHLLQKGVMPSGSVAEGGRFYVGYLDPTGDWSNTALAVFDSAWNLLQDIALTDHSPADNISAASSWVETHGGRIYASWAEVIEPQGGGGGGGGQATPLHVYVDVFEIVTDSTTCSSFTVSPTSASASASAGSQQVTVTGSPSGCTAGSWASSTSDSWLSVSASSGTGPGSVTVSWTANTGASQRTGTATIAGQTFTVTQAGSGTTPLTSDWVPCGPPGGAVGGLGEDVQQPSRTRVLIARSQDGLHFERPSTDAERILLDQGDIPDAVVLPSGRVLVYFMAGCRDYAPSGGSRTMNDAIAVAVSDAGGAPGTWVFKDVTFDNAAQGLDRPFDPNVVLWQPRENLLRMFVSQAAPGPYISTHSYTSTDGFTFTYEGRRYDPGPPDGIVDPETFRFDDTHWYIICGVPEGFATSSDDGATFTGQRAFSTHVTNVTGYFGTPNEVAATNTPGIYRVFAGASRATTGAVGIDSLVSTASPWTSWQWEGPVLDEAGGIESCEVGFPTVVRLAADNWLMFYRSGIPNCACESDGFLFHCSPPTSIPACYAFTISPTSVSPTASVGSQQVTVTGSPSGCTGGSWAATGNGSWLTVSPPSGTGSGSVTVSWDANTDAAQRTSTATIAGQTFTVTQAGGGSSGLRSISSTPSRRPAGRG
jgi:hypothetical protein